MFTLSNLTILFEGAVWMKVERLTKSLIERSDIRKKGWRILILFISLYRLWMIDLVGETDRRQSAVLNKTDESGIVVWRRINVTLGRSKLDADSIGCNPQFLRAKYCETICLALLSVKLPAKEKTFFRQQTSSFHRSASRTMIPSLENCIDCLNEVRLFENWNDWKFQMSWLWKH